MKRSPGEANKALFREFGSVWVSGQIDRLAEMIGPGYVGHTARGDRDAAGLIARIQQFNTLYSDVTFAVLEQLADDDRVASRMQITAIERASGQRVRLFGLNLSRFAGGRIVEEWPVWESAPADVTG